MEIILGKMAGFCGGVKNAIDKTYKEAENSTEEIYCLGDLVHNPVVLKKLEKMGVKIINSLNEVPNPDGKTVIIRAHGVTKDIYEQANKMGIKIKDLTCPKVLKIHDFVSDYAKNGDYIFLIGEGKHPEVIGTKSFCGENCTVIENEVQLDEAIEKIKVKLNKKTEDSKIDNNSQHIEKDNKRKLVIVAQTTFNLEKFKEFEEKIKQELSNSMEVIVNNTICDATRLRQEETDKLSKEVNGMVVIGGKKSSNTNKLYQISLSNCENAVMVEDESDLESVLEKFKSCKKIGVMAGASTPEETINNVIGMLENAFNK